MCQNHFSTINGQRIMLGKNKTVNTLACERQGPVAPGEPVSKHG